MLKSIERIKGLGVYQSYSKPAGTQEFGIKNLIYGWNYSGKTTLSRLFAQLETKAANPDLSGCEFTFDTAGDSITEKNFNRCSLSVRVFNSDFVRSNLHFDGGSFNPILLLGKESEEAQRKIDELSKRIKRSDEVQRSLNGKVEDLKLRIAQTKTDTAKFIRQHLKVDPYTATHLAQDVVAVDVLELPVLAEKELADATELALTPSSKRPNTVEELRAEPSIDVLHKEAVAVLAAIPSLFNTVKYLEENPAVERWVKEGLALHPGSGPCEFCGNDLSQDRLAAFRAHFSKDLSDHNERVNGLLARVKVAAFSLNWPKPAELNAQFREAYAAATEALPSAIDAFNRAVRNLADEVQRKADDSRKSMMPAPLAAGLEKDIRDAASAVNLLIKQNNELAANFEKAKADSLKLVRYHYVQQYVDDQVATGLEQQKTRLAKRSDRLKAYAARLRPEIDHLQAQISKAQQGREKINERLASMLGSEAIQIQVVKDGAGQDRFQLVRKTGAIAKNLSDGERTAVAFSYFLTKLQEIKPAEFKETIVYIDDPISSLDANHIFQVTAAIRALFFEQQDKNSPWQTRCQQLFISTHNFEFFNLLREIKPATSKAGARLFLIRRIAEKSSTLEDMPASLARYQSEYHFLFEVIHRFHKAPDKTVHEVLMLLPNAMRRFIELYTYSRLPGPKDSEQVDERAEILFGVERAKRILKIVHYFSHGNTLDRLALQPPRLDDMYDFRTLSPIDFELLARDLLQAELGITMESFGPGKDGGIDFRFSMADQDVVVQAKHHVEGGARSLLRAATKEDSKVLKLAPSRYILVTSLSLTPELKRKVLQAMPSTPVREEDVIGREDLNNFLGLHPDVLRQHFKLWLTSTEVLERILHSAVYNRTDAELARIRQLVPKFVHNASVAEAETILEDRGALIIAGEPGVGKTTLGRMLLWLHMEQNWKVFVVDDLQEAMAVSTAGEKRLIFLDDFLGQISLTNELLGKVDQRLPVFLDRLRNNKDLRFILTTRLYLLNQAQIQSDKLSSPRVAASEMVLNVGVYTRIIKAKVVFNHIYFSDLVEEEKAKLLEGDFFLNMIDHRNFSPRLIELLTSADYYAVGDDSVQSTVLRVLNNPAELWERPYRSHLSADARCLLWAIFFTGYYIGVDLCFQLFKRLALNAGYQVAPSDALARFRTGLKELSGSFVLIGDQEISFANPGIRDFLSKVFIDDHLLPVVVLSVSTMAEFRSAWIFFRTNIAVCRNQFDGHDRWIAAMSRIQGHRRTTAIESLRYILEMIEHLPGLHIQNLLDGVVSDLALQGIEPRDHYDCLFSLRQLKRLIPRTDEVLDLTREALTTAASNMLSRAGDDLAIENISSIASALELLADQDIVRSAAADALRSFIAGMEEKLADVSSSQELDSLSEELSFATKTYGVPVDAALTLGIQKRRESLVERESEEDSDPYQQAGPQDAASDISDVEIKSMFALMADDQSPSRGRSEDAVG